MIKYDIPTIFIDFDLMIREKYYLYYKLYPIMKKQNINFQTFTKAYNKAQKHQNKERNYKL